MAVYAGAADVVAEALLFGMLTVHKHFYCSLEVINQNQTSMHGAIGKMKNCPAESSVSFSTEQAFTRFSQTMTPSTMSRHTRMYCEIV